MTVVRPPAVAGVFYPESAGELRAAVEYYLRSAQAPPGPGRIPKALIVPHAGFMYSGPIAASAYVRIRAGRDAIRRVVLLGPCHRVPVRGLAVPSVEAFASPLGEVAIDRKAVEGLLDLPFVREFDATHRDEHCLEVHLPFLQVLLERFALVPLVVGDATPEEVAQVIERTCGGPETLLVVSSDLSHYHDYQTAKHLDAATCRAIETMDCAALDPGGACGCRAVAGLLAFAKRRRLAVETLDLRNSGDTAGSRDRVVGYGAWALYEARPRQPDAGADCAPAAGGAFAAQTRALLRQHGPTLLHVAAASIEHGLSTGRPLPINPVEYAPEIRAPGACFVTLHRERRLRGCVGSPAAHRPLTVDAAENAFAAAFGDPRFPRLGADELAGLDLSLSILSRPDRLAFEGEADLIAQLRPEIDGLVIEDDGRRALFLPVVWRQIPDPSTFLARLRLKAGLSPRRWSPSLKAWRFVTEELSAGDIGDPCQIWSIRPTH